MDPNLTNPGARNDPACSPFSDPSGDPLSMVDVRSEEVQSIGIAGICSTQRGGVSIYGNCNAAGPAGENGRARYAFDNQWQPGVYFRRPTAAFMELALKTGGQFCPFLSIPDASSAAAFYTTNTLGAVDENSVLTDTYRDSILNQRLSLNPQYYSPGQIAGGCVRGSLGQNPFTLVQEE